MKSTITLDPYGVSLLLVDGRKGNAARLCSDFLNCSPVSLNRANHAAVITAEGQHHRAALVMFRKVDVDTAAHEADHIAGWILTPRGIKDEEAHCYLLGHIAGAIHEHFTRLFSRRSHPRRRTPPARRLRICR